MNEYGYARVSTKDQHIDRQIYDFYKLDINKKHIYVDKQSGKDFNRPQYLKLLKKLKKEDTLFISSIDRLGRNYAEIIHQWNYITKRLEVNIVVLDMELLDTRKKDNDLTGVFISDLVLQILSYVAQKERENIRKRQREGIDAALKRGIKFGREKIPIPDNMDLIIEKIEKKELTIKEACLLLKMSKSTLYRYKRSLKL